MKLCTSEWGIPVFDREYKGLPINSLNVLETNDSKVGLLSVIRFIMKGIKLKEKVVLITLDSPEDLIRRIKINGLDCEFLIDIECLYILSYKDSFIRSLNLTEDYSLMFDEIKNITSQDVSRLAFFNADLLFNLETYNLAIISASKLYKAAKHSNVTILAQYNFTNSRPHRLLQDVCHSIVDFHIKITRYQQKKLKLSVRDGYYNNER